MSPPKKSCVVTGATGFVGRALIPYLTAAGHDIIAWPRSGIFDFANDRADAPPEWIELLQNSDVVVHLAGLAHQRSGSKDDEIYFRINRDGTLRLAAAACLANVKRFIFMSSAKVFGEGGSEIYRAASSPSPQGAYAQSKWQAEQQLQSQYADAMELVILRPPLVYGPHAKANFANLMRLAHLPLPLPLAGIHNRRSLIGVDNLVDLIAFCLTQSNNVAGTWPCADNVMYSIGDIVTNIRRAQDRQPDLFKLPRPLFALLQRALGDAASNRLFGDFQIDCSETYSALNWRPPFSMEQILRTDTTIRKHD